MEKKTSFGPDFGIFDQIRDADCFFFVFFFPKIWLRQSLDIIVSYHYVQNQKKLMVQS